MSIDDIRTFRHAKPFQPYVLILSDGHAIPVTQAFQLGIAPWGKIGVFEGARLHMLAPEEIVQIRPHGVEAK